jgi:hypothetical protein
MGKLVMVEVVNEYFDARACIKQEFETRTT